MVRYMVATVVTVLAVVVIVMVITVEVLRPEEISVYVLYGHVDMSDLWVQHRKPVARTKAGGLGRRNNPTTTTVYMPEKFVQFGITLGADNPSGRANIYGRNVTIRFLDMPYGGENFTGMMELGEIIMPELSFVVKKKSSHMLTRWQSVDDKTLLSYLASTYGGRRSFTGAVHLTMSISSDTLMGQTRTSLRYVDHFCGPLTFTVDEPRRTARDVPCVQSNGDGMPLF
ncbi:hypothetical protein QOZ80_5BG0451430 [Eleusine coracana subsp. coracana]|nr:hypothetical protein QOZ80_5BG0451430 [Eleusine coracana subsp. coracana]